MKSSQYSTAEEGIELEQEIRVGQSHELSLSGLAQIEAASAGSDRLETHHILLALLSRPSHAGRVLSSFAITRDFVESAVHRVIKGGASEEKHKIDARRAASCKQSGMIPPSLQAERAFFGSIEEATRLGHSAAHWGHVLLGLLLVTDGIAVVALRAAEVDCDAVRRETLAEMSVNND